MRRPQLRTEGDGQTDEQAETDRNLRSWIESCSVLNDERNHFVVAALFYFLLQLGTRRLSLHGTGGCTPAQSNYKPTISQL